jgi:hypothetical protein
VDLIAILIIDLIEDITDMVTIHGITAGGITPGGLDDGIDPGIILLCMLEEE